MIERTTTTKMTCDACKKVLLIGVASKDNDTISIPCKGMYGEDGDEWYQVRKMNSLVTIDICPKCYQKLFNN